MRLAPLAFLCCLLALAATKPASADSKPAPAGSKPLPAGSKLNVNPQVQRNNVDSTVSWTDAVKASQDQLMKVLTKILQATPKPTTPFQLADQEPSDAVSPKTGMVKGTQRWVPIEAWAQREYETGVGAGDNSDNDDAADLSPDDNTAASKFLEVQVALNGTRGLTSGLATKSDKPHIVEVEGAVAVEQTAIPIVDSTQVHQDGSEKAPLEPMTLYRLYVVDSDLETHVRKLQTETSSFPGFGPAQVLADHPDELRSIVISFYGPKSDVETLVKKLDVAALRRLLPG